MNFDKNKIQGKTFALSSRSKKFRLGKSKKMVAAQVAANGGKIVNAASSKVTYDYLVLGRETENFYPATNKVNYLFEGELLDRTYLKDFKYFPDLDIRFYGMLRKLFVEENVSLSYLVIGNPLTEEDFAKYEKKLKRKIPTAVKEFYSIFGEIRLLWSFRVPYERTGVSASRTAWNKDYYDSHVGSFQILPLKTVLFEKWDDPQYCFDVGTDLKIFDSSSEYHMIALDITDEENPMSYRGEDHGVQFREAAPFSFTDYIHLSINLFGKRERFSYFPLYMLNQYNKSKEEIKAAIDGTVEVDLKNKAAIEERIATTKIKVQDLIKAKKYEDATETSYEVYDSDKIVFDTLTLDIARAQNDIQLFISKLKKAVQFHKFNIEEYEKYVGNNAFFQKEEYLAWKAEN